MAAVQRNFFMLEQDDDDIDIPSIAIFPNIESMRSYIADLIEEDNLEYPDKSWFIYKFIKGFPKVIYSLKSIHEYTKVLNKLTEFTNPDNNITCDDIVIDTKGRIYQYDPEEISNGFYCSPLESGSIYLTHTDIDYIEYLNGIGLKNLATQISQRDIYDI